MLGILPRGNRPLLHRHAQGEHHGGGDGTAGDVQAGEKKQALHHDHGRAGRGVHVRVQREAVGLCAESGMIFLGIGNDLETGHKATAFKVNSVIRQSFQSSNMPL